MKNLVLSTLICLNLRDGVGTVFKGHTSWKDIAYNRIVPIILAFEFKLEWCYFRPTLASKCKSTSRALEKVLILWLGVTYGPFTPLPL